MKLHLEFDRPYQAAAVEAICDCWGSLNTGVTNRHLNPRPPPTKNRRSRQ